MSVTLYYNPNCSKSHQTLALLEQHDIHPTIVEYLKQPLSPSTLKQILNHLGYSARELLRTKETEYRTLNLADPNCSENDIINAMHNYPKLIERPIVVKDKRAVIARPAEKVLALIATK